jgi:WD40 repeat protein
MAFESPYKGLVPFDEEDAPFFFGREEERDLIIANLTASRLTLLYGATGVGKSSVLGAGVLYHIHEITREHWNQNRAPEFAIVSHRMWRDDAVGELIKRIQDSVAQALQVSIAELFPEPLGLSETIKQGAARFEDGLLIILDQFESYFLYHGDENGDGSFTREFARIVNDPSVRANFLISIREDALAKLDCFKGAIPRLFDNYMRIEHLDRWDAYDAIIKPVEKYSALLPVGERPYSIEPELVDEVLNQVASGNVMLEAAAIKVDPQATDKTLVEAPFLQLVMDRLWQEELRQGSRSLRLETLKRLGGAQTVIQSHFEEKLNDLTVTQRENAAKIFRQLVTRTGIKIMQTLDDLVSEPELTREAVCEVVDKLSSPGVRILRHVPPPPDNPTLERYEISHDILARAARDWRRKEEKAESDRRAAEEAGERESEIRRELEHERALAVLEEEKRRFALERRRNKELGVLLTSVLVLLGATITLGIIAYKGWNEARSRYFAILSLSPQVQADQDLSVLLANEAIKANRTTEAVSALRLSLFDHQARRTLFRGHTAPVYSGSFSPDGNWIVTAGRDNKALLRRSSGQQPAVVLNHESSVRSANFSADGRRILTACEDGSVMIWDGVIEKAAEIAQRGTPLQLSASSSSIVLMHPDAAFSGAFSADGSLVATACWDDSGWIWDLRGAKPKLTHKLKHDGDVYSAAFIPATGRAGNDASSGQRVVTASKDKTARVWDASTGRELLKLQHEAPVWRAASNRDGTRIVTASEDKTAKVWDAITGQHLLTLRHLDTVRSASFSPDGRWILTGSDDRTARIWDAANGHLLFPPLVHSSVVYSAEFSSDGNRILTTSVDRVVRLWEEFNINPVIAVEPPSLSGDVDDARLVAAFSPDGKAIAVAGVDGTISLWNAERVGQADYRGPEWTANQGGPVGSVDFSRDGSLLLVAIGSGIARVLDRATGTQRGSDLVSDAAMSSAVFSPDQSRIVTGGMGGAASIWDVRGHTLIGALDHPAGVLGVTYSHNGNLIVTAGNDQSAKIWNAQTRELVASLDHSVGPVRKAAFSPDDRIVVTGTGDGSAWVWERAIWGKGGAPRRLSGHASSVNSVAFSKEGSWLVTASSDGTVRIWETATWTSLFELRLHGGEVFSASFDPARAGNPSGERIVTASGDGASLIYTCEACRPVDSLRTLVSERVKRGLTPEERTRYRVR